MPTEHTTILRRLQAQRSFVVTLTVGMMAGVLVVALFLLSRTKEKTPPSVEFNPDKCVRLLDISRVFRIRPEPPENTKLWFASAEGLWYLNTDTYAWHRYGLDHGLPTETIVDVAFDGERVWAATWEGVSVLDSAEDRFVPVRIPYNMGTYRVLSIEHDPNSGMYFYVDNRGLFHVPSGAAAAEAIRTPNIRAAARITAIRAVGDRLLLGIEGRRVVEYYPSSGEMKEVAFSRKGYEKTYVWDIDVLHGHLWVATSDDGVWKRETDSDTLKPVDGFPAKGAYVFAEEEDGFWCGTPFGLWRYHTKEDVWIQLVHPEENEPTEFQVFTLANREDEIWYGSMDLGTGYLRKERIQWRDMRAGLSNDNIAALAATDSLMFVAYGYAGDYIDRFDAAKVQYQRNINYVNGIPDPHIQSLYLYNDTLYYGGYSSFGFIDGRNHIYKYYGRDSKIPYSDVAAITHSSKGGMFLAGLFGVIRYFPARDSFYSYPAAEGSRVTCLLEIGDTLVYGTLGRGVKLLDLNTMEVCTTYCSFVRRVVGLAEAGNPDELYVGTESHGLFRLRLADGNLTEVPVPQDILSGKLSDFGHGFLNMRRFDGHVWLASEKSGCLVYGEESEKWVKLSFLNGLVSNEVLSIQESPSYVWIGSRGGVNRYDRDYILDMVTKLGEE